jgi:trimethylamine:corrinoid methyltransferase-like protein
MMFTLANLTAINKASSKALKNIGTTDLDQKARVAFKGIKN